MTQQHITALRMQRQFLSHKASEAEYLALYRDMQPGQNVYFNGFGDPPTLTYRADFNDMEYNRQRQKDRGLLKVRLAGALGWIVPDDLELFAGAYAKPLDKPNSRQLALLNLLQREGPMNIQLMKEMTGMLVKEITPALHRLQEAFLIYEDQNDGEWDRAWCLMPEMFPDVNLQRYTRHDALKVLLKRFAYRHVIIDTKMAKSFYKLPEKDIKKAVAALLEEHALTEVDDGFMLPENEESAVQAPVGVFAMHRNDFLVKSNEHWLKEKFTHTYPDTLYYLLVDGEFRGAVVGKFRYTPELEAVVLDLAQNEAAARWEEIVQATQVLCGAELVKKISCISRQTLLQ